MIDEVPKDEQPLTIEQMAEHPTGEFSVHMGIGGSQVLPTASVAPELQDFATKYAALTPEAREAFDAKMRETALGLLNKPEPASLPKAPPLPARQPIGHVVADVFSPARPIFLDEE